eukprot:699069-Hanusia_phi.AAC.1
MHHRRLRDVEPSRPRWLLPLGHKAVKPFTLFVHHVDDPVHGGGVLGNDGTVGEGVHPVCAPFGSDHVRLPILQERVSSSGSKRMGLFERDVRMGKKESLPPGSPHPPTRHSLQSLWSCSWEERGRPRESASRDSLFHSHYPPQP